MVNSFRNQKIRTHLDDRKGFGLFAALTALILCNCQTAKQKLPSEPEHVSMAKIAQGEARLQNLAQYTYEGNNVQPWMSPDNREIYFVGFGRQDHNNSQAYKLILENKKIVRITYSDGQVYRPFKVDETVFYSSSTDEEKENLDLTKLTTTAPKPSQIDIETQTALGRLIPSTEIYSRKQPKDVITRLTRSPGADLAFMSDSAGKRLLTVSYRGKKTDINWISPTGAFVKNILTFTQVLLPYPALSPDQKELAWIDLTKEGKSVIMLGDANGKNAKPVMTKTGNHTGLRWTPDGKAIIFSSNIADPTNLDIYMVSKDGVCVERITTDQNQDIDPAFDSTGKMLLFSSQRAGALQIFSADFAIEPPANRTCL